MSMEYYKRIIDAELNDQLDAMGAVLIVGLQMVWKNNHGNANSKKRLENAGSG